MELNHFTETATVLNADCDFHRKLKPSALFRYVEQAAADHARAYGMDDDFFAARHTTFLVGKQAVEVYRMPTRGEKITLDTACEPCKKGSMKRITHILDEAGKELALVDCRWIVVNTETGHIMRQPSWCTPNYENEDVEEELPQLVHKCKELTPGGQLDGQLLAVRPERPCEQTRFIWTSPATPCRWMPSGRDRCASPPSSTTARSRWGRRWRWPMRRRPMAGMWWAAGTST